MNNAIISFIILSLIFDEKINIGIKITISSNHSQNQFGSQIRGFNKAGINSPNHNHLTFLNMFGRIIPNPANIVIIIQFANQ